MGLQLHTPFLPEGTEIVSEELAVHRTEEGWVFYNAGGPIASCASDDYDQSRFLMAVPSRILMAPEPNRRVGY